jgi:cytochrome c-type biogenesis protein CcmH
VSPTTDYPELVEGLSFLPGRRKKGSPSTSSGRAVLYAVAILIAAPLLADSNLPPAYWSNRQLPDPKQEAQAQALMEQLRCLVCQGQSIADSDAELAGDMRDLVRRRIAAGEKPGAIRAWLIQRYGTWISYKPTAEPAAWPLWLAPLALLLVGAWLVRRRIRLGGR